jgi:hypothetical protein
MISPAADAHVKECASRAESECSKERKGGKKKQKPMLDDHDAIKLYNQITLVPIYEFMPTSFSLT